MINKKQNILKTLGKFKILLLPIGAFLLMELISFVFFQRHMFEASLDFYNFFRNVGVTVIASYALSINMSSGRMDLSLGGQRMLGCMVGGNMAIGLGLGPVGVLLFSVVFGVISGAIVGLLFVTLRLPSFVLGIGMALLYESISIIYSPVGFQLFGKIGMGLLADTWFIVAVAVFIAASMYFLMRNSKFGYQYNAIRGSQRVAMNSGINVKKNAFICHALCGGLIALAGVLDTGYTGYMLMTLNLSSTATAFSGFVPVFLALVLQRWCPMELGIPVSVVTFRFLSMGLGKMSLPAAASTTITMAILVCMLVAVSLIGENGIKKRLAQRRIAAQQVA